MEALARSVKHPTFQNWSNILSIKKGVDGERVVSIAVKDFDRIGGSLDHLGLSKIEVRVASLQFVYLHPIVSHLGQYFGDLSIFKQVARGFDTSTAISVSAVDPHPNCSCTGDRRRVKGI